MSCVYEASKEMISFSEEDTNHLSIYLVSCVYEASKEMISFSEENTNHLSIYLSIYLVSCVYEASKEMISFSEENTELWKKLFSNEATKKHEYNSTGKILFNLTNQFCVSVSEGSRQPLNRYVTPLQCSIS